MADELPVGYYLDNFRDVIDFVSATYPDLLTDAECQYTVNFRRLPVAAQRLYVRLVGRKGPLFRDDKLNYPEIADLAQAAMALQNAGYLDHGEEADAQALLVLMTRPELAAMQPGPVSQSARRAELLDQLITSLSPEEIRAIMPFSVIRPLGTELLQIYKLLFFGNLRQDFSEFVLRDLGISPFESYRIHPEDRFFDSREVLEETLGLYLAAESAQAVIESGEVEAMREFASGLPAPVSDQLRRRVGRIRNRIARQVERIGEPAHALAIYTESTVAPSRERQARLLVKIGEADAALKVCREILVDPEDESEFEFAASFASRVARKHSLPVDGLPSPGSQVFKARHITVPKTPDCHVEELARLWFEAEGEQAEYVENGLLPSLFGLAFWDIIFEPVKGVFFNPFQRGPADLFTADFRDARRDSLAARFDALADPARFREIVMGHYAAKFLTANHFVHWGLINETLLSVALDRMPVADLLAVFRRLLRDLRNNRAGFPDLVVFPDAGGYFLAEVKGPGDTLQSNQKRWLRYFDQTGIPAEVVYVQWA